MNGMLSKNEMQANVLATIAAQTLLRRQGPGKMEKGLR